MPRTLHVAEGEKCATTFWDLGLIGTTSQGGSGRATETDWTPAVPFDLVILWEDVDETEKKTGINPGVKYTETVAGLIIAAVKAGERPPEIIIVELLRYWGGNAAQHYGRDVYDLIQDLRQEGKTNEEIAAGLEAIASGYSRRPGTPAALALIKGNRNGSQGVEQGQDDHAQSRSGGADQADENPPACAGNVVEFEDDGNGDRGDNAAAQGVGSIPAGDGGSPAGNPDDARRQSKLILPSEFQSKPIGADPVGRAGRKGLDLSNWDGAEAKSVDEIYGQLVEVAGGWPKRVRSPGAKHPLLFVDYGRHELPKNLPKSASAEKFKDLFESHSRFMELLPGPIMPERIRWIGSGDTFKCWLHERTRLKFRPKEDVHGVNYVTVNDLYQYCGNSRAPEYKAVECRPHWPPLPGHFYAWDLESKYEPDGSALRALLDFFDNCKDDLSRTVALAAIMTPGWGAPYGKKPMIVFQAPDRGCGKTTLAELIAALWGGHLSIDLTGRDQDELIQRLLTPEALTKRVGILDNVKGTLSNVTLEYLVTTKTISGKRLYSGDASRPNTMNYFITMNGPSCSPDVALRSYFVELQKPAYSAQWDERLADFVAQRGCDVVADVGRLMCSPVKRIPGVVDRWPLWGREVLARAADFMSIDVDDVMRRTGELRQECDDEADEANELMAGLLRLIATKRGFIRTEQNSLMPGMGEEVVEDAVKPVFVSSTEMVEIWKEVLGGKMRPRQIWKVLGDHLAAGRLRELSARIKNVGSGYEISLEAMNGYLEKYRKSLKEDDVTKTAEK